MIAPEAKEECGDNRKTRSRHNLFRCIAFCSSPKATTHLHPQGPLALLQVVNASFKIQYNLSSPCSPGAHYDTVRVASPSYRSNEMYFDAISCSGLYAYTRRYTIGRYNDESLLKIENQVNK
ncbi:hypothetical protein CEXT_48781 [Caerostris extrusa]|uniref:Uncharacterized protein n=1 Tax=Caerostris extrusa TaxID=172846 RepID=A0AAV4SYW9_CAEEX|nr:hypothetical protein CEXT_48781 [Caerostris extrusa]